MELVGRDVLFVEAAVSWWEARVAFGGGGLVVELAELFDVGFEGGV